MGDPIAVLAAAALAVAVLAGARPQWTLTLLLAALPLATHHPATAPTVLLVVLTGVFQAAYAIRTRPSPRAAWRAVATQPLLLLSALFVVAAFLSLTAAPLASVWQEQLQSLRHVQSAYDLATRALSWLIYPEPRREFAIVSAVLTLQGFGLALIVWREARASTAMAVRMAAAITAGMVAVIVLGLLEVFAGVSLAPLRGDTAGSVAVRTGMLQSVSGNPGWFSQYLVYALPYSLVLLAGVTATRLRLGVLATLAGAAAFSLLLVFQRGGWLAGLLVLAYIAYVAAQLVQSATSVERARRHLPWRMLIYATTLIVVAGGFSLWLARTISPGAVYNSSAYLDRLTSIASGDRLPYTLAGLRITALHPVLGAGHESFAYRYAIYYDRPGGPFSDSTYRVPVPSSAHNVYLQTSSGTGLVGLAILIGLFATAAVTANRIRRRPGASRAELAVVAAAFGSLLGMSFYGLVQEVFYVHALRLMFFVAVGLIAGLGADLVRWPARLPPVLWATLSLALVLHLVYEHVWPGPDRLLSADEPTGLYAEDVQPQYRGMQWSAEEAAWPVPAGASRYAMRIRSFAPYPQDVEFESCDGSRSTTHLADHDWHEVSGSLTGCAPGNHLRLRVTPTWSAPGDWRSLGVVTSGVKME
jgi:hypothetical protein